MINRILSCRWPALLPAETWIAAWLSGEAVLGHRSSRTKWRGFGACLNHANFSARQGVEDDEVNMICLGGLVFGHAHAWELVKMFLAARFSGAERHPRRLSKLAEMENQETRS